MLLAGGMAVTVVVWLVRLEGRVNMADSHNADLKATVEEIRADVKTLLLR